MNPIEKNAWKRPALLSLFPEWAQIEERQQETIKRAFASNNDYYLYMLGLDCDNDNISNGKSGTCDQ